MLNPSSKLCQELFLFVAISSDIMLLCSGINKPVAVLSWYMTAKPTEDYIIIVDADMIIMKPFDPVQMGVKPGAIPTHAA